MRDATVTKIRVDQLKLAQLGNLIDASYQSEELREYSDLEVEFWHNWKGIRNNIWSFKEAKMVITWWKALVESDVASIDRDVKAENVAILRFLSPPHQETKWVNKRKGKVQEIKK